MKIILGLYLLGVVYRMLYDDFASFACRQFLCNSALSLGCTPESEKQQQGNNGKKMYDKLRSTRDNDKKHNNNNRMGDRNGNEKKRNII